MQVKVKTRQETTGFSGDKNWKSSQFSQILRCPSLTLINFVTLKEESFWKRNWFAVVTKTNFRLFI